MPKNDLTCSEKVFLISAMVAILVTCAVLLLTCGAS